MDDKIVVALISGGAAVAAAIVTGLVSRFSAREKSKQLEKQYVRELEANHLENARQHVEDLYIPVSKAISLFSDRFRRYQTELDSTSDLADPTQVAQLREAIEDLEEFLQAIRERGAEVFMIPELEELLFPFAVFLRESLDSGKSVVKAVVSVNVGLLGVSASAERAFEVSRSLAGRVRVPGFGIGFSYEAEEVLAAPVTSTEFVNQVSETLPKLRAALKIVTLGPRGVGLHG